MEITVLVASDVALVALAAAAFLTLSRDEESIQSGRPQVEPVVQQLTECEAVVDLGTPSHVSLSDMESSRIRDDAAGPDGSIDDSADAPQAAPQAVSFSDPRISGNIVERQHLIADHIGVIEGRSQVEGWTPGLSLAAAALLSVQVIHDATGKSHYPPEPIDGQEGPVLFLSKAMTLTVPTAITLR